MSNDLISREKVTQDISEIFADVLISSIRRGTASFDEVNRRVQECLKNQPAVYDVDKVVKQIKSSSTDEDGIICYVDKRPVITKDIAVKIAKSGGIECSNYLKNEDRRQEPADHETKSVPTVQNICEG